MSNNVDNLDPVDYYLKDLKQAVIDNANTYFDDIVKKTKTNEEENKITADKIINETNSNNDNEKQINKLKIIRILLIFIPIIGWLIIFLVINKKLKALREQGSEIQARLTKLHQEADAQLKAMKMGFRFNDFNNIVRKSTKAFEVEDYFSTEKLMMLTSLYNYQEDFSDQESILEVMSGNVATNPFLRVRVYREYEGQKAYTGSRTVHYTKTYRDSKGNLQTRTVSETLHATISKPAPFYCTNTYTIYGNNAAPDLTFSRHPSGIGINPSQKEVDKYVKSNSKELKKLADNAIKNGGTFTALANEEFETFFKAYNRNHEAQFRLLFTPLAQQNMLELIKGKAGYGDDFSFYKQKKINIINSNHGKSTPDYNEFAYVNYYDLRKMKAQFVTDIKNIFDSIYFELAPILAIPLYQMTDAGEFNIKEEYQANITRFESEALVNNMNVKSLQHPDTKTNVILKSAFVKKVGKSDVYSVKAYSFDAIPETEEVPVIAGNGHTYLVPVQYYRYEPLEQESYVWARQFNGNRDDYYKFIDSNEFKSDREDVTSTITRNGCFVGGILTNDYTQEDEDKISSQIERFLDKINS
jgi:hypothetical protein